MQHLQEALNAPNISPSYVDPVADHDMYAMLAEVAAQNRDLVALKQYVPLAEATALRSGHVLYQAIAHRAWGITHRLAGESTLAVERLDQALLLFRRLDAQWQIGRTFVERGELALACGDTNVAQDSFTQALTAFEGLGATPNIVQVRIALDTLR